MSQHSLVLDFPFFYVIGGSTKNIPSYSCYKVDIVHGSLYKITSISNQISVLNSTSIVVREFVYVFNLGNEKPSIFKYNTKFDLWEEIPMYSNNFKVSHSDSATVF